MRGKIILFVSISICLFSVNLFAESERQFVKGDVSTKEKFIFYENTADSRIAKIEIVETILDEFAYELPEEISQKEANLLWTGGNINRDDCESIFVGFTNNLISKQTCQNVVAKHSPQENNPYFIEVTKKLFKKKENFCKNLVIILISGFILMALIFLWYQSSLRTILDYSKSMLSPMIKIMGLNLFFALIYVAVKWLGGFVGELGVAISFSIYVILVFIYVLKPLFDSSFEDVKLDLWQDHKYNICDPVLWVLMNFMTCALAALTQFILYNILLGKMSALISIDWALFIFSWLGVSLLLAVSLSQLFRKEKFV